MIKEMRDKARQAQQEVPSKEAQLQIALDLNSHLDEGMAALRAHAIRVVYDLVYEQDHPRETPQDNRGSWTISSLKALLYHRNMGEGR